MSDKQGPQRSEVISQLTEWADGLTANINDQTLHEATRRVFAMKEPILRAAIALLALPDAPSAQERDLLGFAGIYELLDEAGITETDQLKHRLEDWERWDRHFRGADAPTAEGWRDKFEQAKLAAYRKARVFEPSLEGYGAAMAVYIAAFGEPGGDAEVVTPTGHVSVARLHAEYAENLLPASPSAQGEATSEQTAARRV